MKINSNRSEVPQAVSENIIIQETGSELLIYNLSDHRVLSLNQTARCVWNLCDGLKTTTQIKQQASETLNSDLTDDFILLTLSELDSNNLLIKNNPLDRQKSVWSNVSRREVLRRAGLATAVALPVISSLIAPAATNAQSNLRPLNAACTTDRECQSNCCMGTCTPIDDCFF